MQELEKGMEALLEQYSSMEQEAQPDPQPLPQPLPSKP